MITWLDFEYKFKTNTRIQFENLCLVLFNYKFFNNNKILSKSPNNPGIEIDPVDYNGRKISFQAKYFNNKISYTDILDSAKKIVENYKDKIDDVYLFCNKDITSSSESFKKVKNLLKKNNITLIRFCNQEILNYIETNKIDTIKELFFGMQYIDSQWFSKHLNNTLQELKPRYMNDLNVNVGLQKYFEFIYCTNERYLIINEIIENVKQEIIVINDNNRGKLSFICDEIISLINSLNVKDLIDNGGFLNCYSLFLPILTLINDKINETKVRDAKDNICISDLYNIKYHIEKLNFGNNHMFKNFNKKIFLIEGSSGYGKSHLLGYEADKHKNQRTIFLLGQSLINDNNPLEQIKSKLNITIEFYDLLNILEGMGEIDGMPTIIMIDAINESANFNIWRDNLNSLFNKIEEYKYIKLVCSIRNTYKENIFNIAIKEKIKLGQIVTLRHNGFRGVMKQAIEKYFEYYQIPLPASSYLEYTFENPLFLKLFCQAYTSNNSVRPNNIIGIFNNYIRNEENNIKLQMNEDSKYDHFMNILKNVSKYLFDTNKNNIKIDELYEINKNIPNFEKYITKLLKSEILIEYFDRNRIMRCYFSYERMADILMAQQIIDECQDLNDLRKYIIKNLFKVDENNRLIKRNAIGVFSAISIIVSDQYQEEILDCLLDFKMDEYDLLGVMQDYIKNFIYRNDDAFNLLKLNEILKDLVKDRNIIEDVFDSMMVLASREKSKFNAICLHDFLFTMPLNRRDYIWTVYINDKYHNGTKIYELIEYFNNNKFDGSELQKELYAILFTWFLTASDRKLRDNTSRCIVNILVNDYELMMKLLRRFQNVNDPYVIQRLYGIVYGAVLKSDFSSDKLILLCNEIFENIFNKELIYTDILLRDYALNIIEYASINDCNLHFDIKKCRPPYKSIKIPKINKSILKDYENNTKNYTGLERIKKSITPCINGWMYGDFGRYVFQNAVAYFKNVDMENIFYYALHYIKDNLKYDNEMFTIIDDGYSNFYGNKSERIGKKYQWITFYHILAIISDNYEYKKRFDEDKITFNGAWRPYVRDFDPTLDLINNDRIHSLNYNLNQPLYKNWDLNNEKWIDHYKDVFNYNEFILTRDSNDEEWVMLYGYKTDKSSSNYENDYREVWRMVSAYFIDKHKSVNFLNELEKQPLVGRWFPESHERYNLFSREYSWSPAYLDEYGVEVFDVEIDTNETIITQGPNIIFEGFDGKMVDLSKEKYEQKIRKSIGKVIPSWNEYSWEEQYDQSKESVISYYIPSKILMDTLGLTQIKNGVFALNGEIVVIDFTLVKGKADGLYIKKSILKSFLEKTNMSIFWVCLGEKNDIKKFNSKSSNYRDFCALIYEKNDNLETKSKFYGERDNMERIYD